MGLCFVFLFYYLVLTSALHGTGFRRNVTNVCYFITGKGHRRGAQRQCGQVNRPQ